MDDWEDRIAPQPRTGRDRFWAALNMGGVAVLFVVAAGMARADAGDVPAMAHEASTLTVVSAR